MPSRGHRIFWRLQPGILTALICVLAATGCAALAPVPPPVSAPPIRFLLTFDDGPSAAIRDNPTEKVIGTLAHNPTQPGIKAIFFVQTRWSGAGRSAVGQHLMHRLTAEGHVLAIHSGSPDGHINHRTLGMEALSASLADARADIKAITGETTSLVRPPYWAFDASTLAVYDQARMAMLLTDLRARDGALSLFQVDPETGGRLRDDFGHFRRRLLAGHIPTVKGIVPVVVTFHDVNPYTANHLATYLTTLVRTAHEAGLDLADPPFYNDPNDVLQAAHARANNRATRADLAP